MPRLERVISGGQTGTDQAALRAARDCGIAIGGWCPPGRASEDGIIPAEFPLRETPHERSPDAADVPRSQRTQWNVRDCDATLILRTTRETSDRGTALTALFAEQFGRPMLECDVADADAPDRIRRWLDRNAVRTLNVAGASERTAPGVGDAAYALLRAAFVIGQRR
jgi:hypothetical protein